MIEASDGSLYTGITTDVERRFAEHREGKQGARYFRGREPRRVVYVEPAEDRSTASKREATIKQLRRTQKLQLIVGGNADGRIEVVHEPAQQHFYIELEHGRAVLEYQLLPNQAVNFYRTYVPGEYRNQSLAERLVRTGLAWANQQGLKVRATCWYVQKFL